MIININSFYQKINYDIVIEENILTDIKDYIDFPDKVMIITDTMIPWFYYDEIKKAKNDVIIYKIKAGESNKTIESYQEIMNKLIEYNFAKTDMIIAIGGGVVGDVAGYVAGSYKRGIRLINIPTSLLAMIDSSIGGKTGIDYKGIKNVIGMYYMPEKVLISLNTLKTLPKRHYFNGLMEACKCGLIGDVTLFDIIKDSTPTEITNYSYDIIRRSINVKKKIVEKDPFEHGKRKLLNFGHTIGHALEMINLDTILHGEAISYGMLPFISQAYRKQMELIISKYISVKDIDIPKPIIIDKIKNDKKWNNGYLDVVIVKKIGKAEIKKYTMKEIEEVINEINFWI